MAIFNITTSAFNFVFNIFDMLDPIPTDTDASDDAEEDNEDIGNDDFEVNLDA